MSNTSLLDDLLLSENIKYVKNGDFAFFKSPSLPSNSNVGDIVWAKSLSSVHSVHASVVIASIHLNTCHLESSPDTVFYFVENPRNVYRIILNNFFSELILDSRGLNQDALFNKDLISLSSVISDGTTIGEAVVIHPNVIIYPNVVIGNNVEIGAGTVIGSPGLSYVRQQDQSLQRFPHIGGVVIEDNVAIGANACIDSGGLAPTVIGYGSKMGNFCQIAHNVIVGKHCLVAGRVQIGGGSKVGDCTQIWPSVVVSNKINIGKRCEIKIGSVVVKDVADDESVSGNFAIPHSKFLKNHIKLLK